MKTIDTMSHILRTAFPDGTEVKAHDDQKHKLHMLSVRWRGKWHSPAVRWKLKPHAKVEQLAEFAKGVAGRDALRWP